jgi:hypothetical protein
MTLPAEEWEVEVNRYEPDVIDADESDGDSYPIDQYDLVSSPNDFNVKTIVDFIDSGVVVIPGFQRNFVWDIRRASRLIESLIVGLPVPQIFLYEQGRDKYLVIDGQQRLMSIYYFVKERFPRKEKLPALRSMLQGQSTIPEGILLDDDYFGGFRLNLPENVPGQPNRFHGRLYSGLDDDHQRSFYLRTIRNIVVRQVAPAGDDAMYEIFNRLNSGGMNLAPQEIRRCMFDSKFYDFLYKTNTEERWRDLVGAQVPDIHMKDVEILLRGFAMLMQGDTYRPSMVKFLNGFSKQARSFDGDELTRLQSLLDSFLSSCKALPSDAFHSIQGRFSPMIFESVFVAACHEPYMNGKQVEGKISLDSLNTLKSDPDFRNATQSRTTAAVNVNKRLSRARNIIVSD